MPGRCQDTTQRQSFRALGGDLDAALVARRRGFQLRFCDGGAVELLGLQAIEVGESGEAPGSGDRALLVLLDPGARGPARRGRAPRP